MNFKALRIFLAVYEERSFTQAAVRLNSTQPGVSVQIAALEAELGVKLFERGARGISPTLAAQRFYARSVQIVRETKDAVEEMRALAGTLSKTITVGAAPALGATVLAPALSRFFDECPNVDVCIRGGSSHELLTQVANREIDFAFVTLGADHSPLALTPLFTDRLAVVSGEPLNLPRGVPISLDKPPLLQLILPRNSLVEQSLRSGRIVPARILEVASFGGMLEFVANGEWATLAPMLMVRPRLAELKLCANEIAGEPFTVHFFTASLPAEPLSPASATFIGIVKEELQRLQDVSDRRSYAA